jgi:hypothetical protein
MPWQHFRSWLRNGPPGERALTAAAAAVTLAWRSY